MYNPELRRFILAFIDGEKVQKEPANVAPEYRRVEAVESLSDFDNPYLRFRLAPKKVRTAPFRLYAYQDIKGLYHVGSYTKGDPSIPGEIIWIDPDYRTLEVEDVPSHS